jgi:anti-sigma factor RsiW
MKHPAPEEWSGYVFGESSPDRKRELSAHLAACPECAEEIGGWQRSLQRLDQWELPSPERRTVALQPVLKFAMAACFLLLIGFALGRQFNSSAALRAEFQQGVAEAEAKQQAQFNALLRSLPELVRTAGEADRRAILAQIERMQTQHTADFISLRRDLETVASLTEEEIRQANYKLLQFASATSPE